MRGNILKIPLVSCAWSSGRGRRRCLTSNLLKSLFIKIPDLVHRPTAAAVNSQFCVSFHFVLIRKPADVYQHMGHKSYFGNVNYLLWCLYIKRSSSFHHIHAGNRCNGYLPSYLVIHFRVQLSFFTGKQSSKSHGEAIQIWLRGCSNVKK